MMKTHLGKPTRNALLAIGFLFLVFVIAGVSMKQTLRAVNAITSEDATLKQHIKNTKEKIEGIYSSTMLNFTSHPLVNKGTYIELNGLMARLMGQRRMNGVVKLNNGHLTGVGEKFDTSPYVSGLKQLKELCDSRNTAFLYVQAPVKICKYDKQLPAGFSDFTNENMDEFLSLVRGEGIETLDLREELHNDGLDHYQAFFKTDSHWTPETGFWASNKIKSYFVNKGILGNTDTAVSDLSNYNIDIHPDIFIGHEARRTGVTFGGIDNISLIYPKFDTDIHFSATGVDKSGSFKDHIFDMSYMTRGFEVITYNVYLNCLREFTRFNNEAAENKKTVLIGSDSFGGVVVPFLSLSIENLVFDYYSSNIVNYANTANPDIVVVLSVDINTRHLQAIADAFENQPY